MDLAAENATLKAKLARLEADNARLTRENKKVIREFQNCQKHLKKINQATPAQAAIEAGFQKLEGDFVGK